MATHTLLLRSAGPMQSWGRSSYFDNRDTSLEPTKSGIVGILSAALGRSRNDDVSDLAQLRMGVRIDQAGTMHYDFQTVQAAAGDPGIIFRDKSKTGSTISKRYFLQDAVFLVGLEGDDLAFLTELDAALRAPVYPIGLGRRSYVPSVPVAMPGTGVRTQVTLCDALEQEPWPVACLSKRAIRTDRKRERRTRRLVLEDPGATNGTIRNDQPIGAAFSTRVFGPRIVAFCECEPEERGDLDDWL